MKHLQLFEEFINEGKSFEFSFNYNTDEDDVEYIQNILMNAGVDAIAEPGLDSEEMVVKAKNAVELRKAKKAIQADGFEINESVVNEGDMTKFYDGFIVLDSKTKKTYKFKYVKGTKNTQVESNAISKLASSTNQPSSNFMVHGFIQKGEWNNSKEKTIDESVVNETVNAKDIKVGTILNFKDGETWKVTKTSGISSGKIFAAPYGDTKKSYVSVAIEFSIENLEKDLTSIE
jgi:hypothetical protein